MRFVSRRADGEARDRRPSPQLHGKILPPVEGDESLTARERQILACFAEGLGTAAIANRLSISPTTVRNHSQRILAKLRVHSRLQAVACGYGNGLIPVPTPDPRRKEKK